MAYETRDLQVRITGDASSFNNSINETTKSTNSASTSFGKLSLAVAAGQAIYRGAADAIGALTDFITGSIDAAAEYQSAIVRLDTGLKNTGEDVAKTSKLLIDQADALQLTTKFSDDQIVSADAMLTTFQLQGDTIKRLTPSLLDMAEGMRDADGNTMSLNDTAKLMGKVMGNAEGGIDGLSSALRRNGVIMTDAQKAIFTTGTEAERTNTLIDILSFNFGGQAVAAGDTYAGKMAILTHEYEDFQKKVGLAIINALDPFIQKIMAWARTDDAQNVIKGIVTWVGNLVTVMVKWVTEVAIPWVTKHWPEIKQSLKSAWDMFAGFMQFITASGKVFQVLGLLIWGICDGIAHFIYTTQLIVQGVIAGVIGFVNTTVAIVTGAFNALVWVASSIGDAIGNALMGAVNGVVSGVKWVINGLIDIVNTAIGGINAVTGLVGIPSIPSIQHLARGGIVGGSSAQGDNVLVAATSGEMVLNKTQQTNLLNILNGEKSSQMPNITVNVGMYAGMPVEKREIALSLYKELVRAARSQNVQLPMIGAIGVQ